MHPGSFVLGLQSFKVENCRNKGDHNDSDWLTVTVTSGQTVLPTQTALIGGNLHAGDIAGPVLLGPFEIDHDKLVTVTFAVVNLSHTDDQERKIAGIALSIAGAALTVVSGLDAVLDPFSELTKTKVGDAILGAVGGVLSTIGGLVLGESDPNCDGEVLSRTLSFLPGELKPQFIGPNLETAKSPSECGNDPHSTVTYGIQSAPSIGISSAMEGLARLPSHLDVFWEGPDHAIGSTFWDAAPGSGWADHAPFPITPPGAAQLGSRVAAVARTANHLDVFWVGPDGAIGSTFWDAAPGSGWSDHAPVPITPPRAAQTGSRVAAVARTANHLDVFWVGPDGAIGSTFWDAAPGSGWSDHAPFPITPPRAAVLR